MSDFATDPIQRAVQNGIRGDIEFNLDNGRFRAAVILIYSGMDAMAFIGMPADQTEVKGKDFISWADRYIQFPCPAQVSGAELYGARCGMLHTYTIESKATRQGKCRMIGYADHAVPEVRANPAVTEDLVMVSIRGLKEAFFRGVDQFLVQVFADKERARLAEDRLARFVQWFPFQKDGTTQGQS